MPRSLLSAMMSNCPGMRGVAETGAGCRIRRRSRGRAGSSSPCFSTSRSASAQVRLFTLYSAASCRSPGSAFHVRAQVVRDGRGELLAERDGGEGRHDTSSPATGGFIRR
ncbi:MAG: hypothetical protein U1G05_19470 [Kiritimatiellia bacterium]